MMSDDTGQLYPGERGVTMSLIIITLTLLSILHTSQAFVIHEGGLETPANVETVVDSERRMRKMFHSRMLPSKLWTL